MTRTALLFVLVSLFAAGCAREYAGSAIFIPEPSPADAPGLDRNVLATVRIDLSDGGHGSGFFVSRDGYIITARHVVHGETGFIVRALNEDGKVTLIGGFGLVVAEDEANDLALIKVDFQPAHAVVLAAEGEARAGDAIYAVGYPHSFGILVARGHLMSTHYVGSVLGSDLLVIDANGGPGDSGAGIYLAGSGKLIGIWQLMRWDGKRRNPQMVIHLGVGVGPIRRLLEANRVPFNR